MALCKGFVSDMNLHIFIVFSVLLLLPMNLHLVATYIECIDPGFESCVLLWCGHIPVVLTWFIKGGAVCKTYRVCMHLKDPLESVNKTRGFSRIRVPVSLICP